MCGIAGIYDRDGAGCVSEIRLHALARTQAHRGPDAFGWWMAADRRVGLAAHRLAIVDRTAVANQPLAGCRDDIRIVFNGELYDHGPLRRELEAAGHRFRSARSDTEVAVHAFEQWGADCVRRFRGEFAFAAWDGRTGRLCLARDRLGVKPLHFTVVAGRLLFASEAAALCDDAEVDGGVCPQGVSDYLTLLCVPAPGTMLRGVSALPAGSVLLARAGEVRVDRYWDAAHLLNTPDATVTGDGAIEEFDHLVDTAVRLRVPDEVPFATTLSSGVDSILVTAVAAAGPGPRAGAHVAECHAAAAASERGGATSAAAALGVDLTVHTVHDDGFRQTFRDLVERSGSAPLAAHDIVVLHHLTSAARAAGSKVLLVGEGGDEIGGGYPSYSRVSGGDGAVARHIQVFPTADKRQWWRGAAVRDTETAVRSLIDDIDPALPDAAVRQTLLGEFRLRLPQFLLPRVDAATMAASVEARPPLLDHVVVERALRLPSSVTWSDGEPKYVLRQLLARRYGPGLVAGRKLGFGRAFGPLLERSLPGWVDTDVLAGDHPLFEYVDRAAVVALRAAVRRSSGPARSTNAFRLWVVYALAMWLRSVQR
jgi:asparagine synthase (glutamine-hydrolysing)